MFLYDQGIVPTEEPFKKVIHQGMITKDGNKMGKSKGNAVNPDDYDPDELRMYLMFIGHYFDGGDWSDKKIVGIRRFLGRMKRWLVPETVTVPVLTFSQTKDFINLIDSYVLDFKFNKVVSSFMEFYNANKHLKPDKFTSDLLVQILQVFSPGFRLTNEH
jgi:leucyl-tRNA synthetase